MEKLIADINRYLEARKMNPATFGAYAVGDGKFYKRITNGGECLPRTEAKVRAYMAAHPPEKSQVSQ